MRIFEDGFGYILTAKDWATVRTALAAGISITILGAAPTPNLVVNWLPGK